MDATRFDTLIRSITFRASRRGIFSGLASAFLAIGPLALGDDAEARKRKKKGKGKKKKGGKPPTCTDGRQNGSETDVDCGGTCPRCANGQRCFSRNDCASATCSGAIGASSGACEECSGTFCAAAGACLCLPRPMGGSKVCVKNSVAPFAVVCDLCPDGTICVQRFDGESGFYCREACAVA